ncbi:MAG: NAD(+)/NADH kinase [Chloroflexi bacterium]|nr:NAD(+)/NADH kinase [Chloroflexota bacterium]
MKNKPLKKIGLFLRKKDIAVITAREIVPWLESQGATVFLTSEDAERIGMEDPKLLDREFYSNLDMILSLGGDGTFLRASREAAPYNLPILGINLGGLGFLTELYSGDWKKPLKNMISGRYELEKRYTLECRVLRNGSEVFNDFALNDAVIHRGISPRLLYLKITINDEFAGGLSADGLIVCTPTGSTAYSLAAGGPIVSPRVNCFIINAICPHTLSARPMVVSDEEVIKIYEDEERNPHRTAGSVLTIDGQVNFPRMPGDIVEVRRGPHDLFFIRIEKSFYSMVREKLKWVK